MIYIYIYIYIYMYIYVRRLGSDANGFTGHISVCSLH